MVNNEHRFRGMFRPNPIPIQDAELRLVPVVEPGLVPDPDPGLVPDREKGSAPDLESGLAPAVEPGLVPNQSGFLPSKNVLIVLI
jgi:hypothetical protein